MKGLGLVVLSAFLIIACIGKKAQFTAQINGVSDQTKVYLSKIGKNNQPIPIDTVEIADEKFSFNLLENEPQQVNIIKIEGLPGNVFFINEQEPVQAILYKDSLQSSVINGGKHNQLLMEYISTQKKQATRLRDVNTEMRQAMMNQDRIAYTDLRKEQKAIEDENVDYRKSVAASNPKSIIAVLALSDLLSSKKISNKEAKAMYAKFSNLVKDHTLGKLLGENIAKMSKTDIGAEVEFFEAPTPEGDVLSLKDAMGELTLIDFWASWCKPCRIENPNVVSVYNDYKDKGFSIISVSLDKNKKSWEKAIEDDNMDWYHISNLKYWDEPIARKWGVSSIPATFLIDKNGIIVAKNLRGQALRDKVDEYLGNR